MKTLPNKLSKLFRSTLLIQKSKTRNFVSAIAALVLFTSVMPTTNVAAAYVDPATCGGEDQPTCYLSSAKYLGKVHRPNPGNGAFVDPRNGGEYWRCPAGYARTVFPVNADNACEKTNGNPGNGAFLDLRNGGEYWRCPAGYARTVFAVTAGNACEKTNHNPGGGAFWDPRSGGQWWRCPGGYNRTLSAVTASDACSKSISKPTHHSFSDPRNGGEWWECGSGWGRSIEFPVNHGSKACYQWYFHWGPKIRYKGATYRGKTLERRHATHVANAVEHNSATHLGPWKTWSSAEFVSAVKNPMPSGAFEDPRLDDLSKGAEYWTCPSGFWRNLNAVTDSAACSANVGEACDAGFIDVGNPVKGYTCYKKGECGKNGERPCLIVERIPSCDSGLAEDFVDGICVDANLAMCLTAARGLWLIRKGAEAANNSEVMKTFKTVEKELMKLVAKGIEEIKKTLPKPIRDQFDRDLAAEIVALLPADFEGAQEKLLAELGVDPAVMKKVFAAASSKSSELLTLIADPKICYMTEQEQTAAVNSILGFDPTVALNIAPTKQNKGGDWPGAISDFLLPPAHATGHASITSSWMMFGAGGGLNYVHPQTKLSVGVALDLYLAVGIEGQGARLFFAMGPAFGFGDDTLDINGTFGFKTTDAWGSFEGWAGALGISTESLPSKGIRTRINAAGFDVTFTDPFAKLDKGKGNLHLDGFSIPIGDLSDGQEGLGISANMQHTWRINPKPGTYTPSKDSKKMCTNYPVEGDPEKVPCKDNESTWSQNTSRYENTMD